MEYGAPAKKNTLILSQQDGTQLIVTLQGDEFFHFYETEDGIPVFLDEEGNYCYGDIIDNKLQISNILAHNPDARGDEEKEFLSNRKNIISKVRQFGNTRRIEGNSNRLKRKIHKASLGKFGDYKGQKKGLVILVEFPNLKFTSEYASLDFNKAFNGKGYTENGSIGSVSDYFYAQSYGKFNLTFDIVGPVMMDNPYEYYGANEASTGSDKRAGELIREACIKADPYTDFNDYDWDKDGEVDQVFIIYAGYGEHAGASSSTIWPHESSIVNYELNLDGVRIGTYGCSCELSGNSGKVIDGIGTACHEFSHCLGFPDLYDTDYSGAFGMGDWDIMDSGSYSGPERRGEIPYGYSAYERWMAGWLEPVEITEDGFDYELKDLESSPEAYLIYNDGNRNEFFIIENHQGRQWFSYVGNLTGLHGMMVSHVNYDEKAWTSNKVNSSPRKQYLSIIPADNEYGKNRESYLSDLFPGPGNVKILGNTTHVETGGLLYNANTDGSNYMNKAIVDIEEDENGTVHFGIIHLENFVAPEPIDATEIDEEGFTANWIPSELADSYKVECLSVDFSSGLPVPKNVVIDNISTSSVRINWPVDSSVASQFRVKAYYHGLETNWSPYKSVEKSGGEDSLNMVESENGHGIAIFGLDGLRRDTILPGFNIVRTPEGVRKIFIPQ